MRKSMFSKSAVVAFALIVGAAGCASKKKPDPMDSVSGVITMPKHVKLSPAAVAHVRLVDVTGGGYVEGKTVVAEKAQVAEDGTIPFTLVFKEKQINPNHKYAVDARIVDKNRVLLIGGKKYPVVTKGNPDTVEMEVAGAF
ncbi:MAG: YbaY family lipoprotein [Tepidisphaeraceae bacterium]